MSCSMDFPQTSESSCQIALFITFSLVPPVLDFLRQCQRGGARGSVVVKALCHKQEGHGFDIR
jgi:hypothetical protein